MDTRFFTFVWRYSRREQLFILALTLASFPLVYISLEIPKIIVNEAISGTDFPKSFFGVELEQVPYLIVLCFAFLAMVILINGIKWVMNVAIGMTGERMLRRLRFMLFEHVMRFKISRFRTTKPGEVIQSMLGEIEPLGGFIGEVIATPFFQGGLLVVYSVFIFMQDPLLGLAAVALYPMQAWLIPKLQAKVIRLNKERAANTRGLADTISESVGNIAEIHTNDTARWHMGQIAGRLHSNTVIRLALFKRKFTIKFINNLINQLTPFFFYSVGGYLVIKGELDFGSLVAVLAAYKDLAGPWKAVLNYVQRWTDFNSRYVFVVENFIGDGVLGPERVYDTEAAPLEGPLVLTGVEGGPGAGGLTVADLTIAPGEMVAVTGGGNGAREVLLAMMTGLAEPAAGRVTLGGRNLSEARLAEIGGAVSHIDGDPGMISGTIRENMLYGLYRATPDLEKSTSELAREFLKEARATGNITADPKGDWVDYEAAGVAGPDPLQERLLALVARFDLSPELFSSALNRRFSPDQAERWNDVLVTARAELVKEGDDLSDLVEFWSPDGFNENASLIENLLYALPVEPVDDFAEYAKNKAVEAALDRGEARGLLEEIGWDIAREFAELVDAVEDDSIVLDSFSAYAKAELQSSAALIEEFGARGLSDVPTERRQLLLSLALKFVPNRDRLEVLTPERTADILAARGRLRPDLADRPEFVGFEEARFNPAQTISENLIHGSRRYDRKSAWKQLDDKIERTLTAMGLYPDLVRLGLDGPVGSGGSGLSASIKRRIALVRSVIKRPGLIVLDGVAGGDDAADEAVRAALRAELPDATLVYAAASEKAGEGADRILAIAENGTVAG